MIKSEKFLDYSQPNFYHFSEDSIRLADYVVSKIEEKNLSENQRSLNCLDLCAGCGVIGLEVVLKGSFAGAINFCEINRDYSSFLIENQKKLKSFKDLPEIRFNNFFQSFSIFKFIIIF